MFIFSPRCGAAIPGQAGHRTFLQDSLARSCFPAQGSNFVFSVCVAESKACPETGFDSGLSDLYNKGTHDSLPAYLLSDQNEMIKKITVGFL